MNYESTTDEENMYGETMLIKKRVRSDDESDIDKRRKRQMGFERENLMGQGIHAITPSRYHVVNHERRLSPGGRIPTHKEEIDQPSNGELVLNE